MIRRRLRRPSSVLSCREVGRVLQRFLDGDADELTARRVRRHLDACRRCGLEASTYEEIKAALGRTGTIDHQAAERLRAFGEQLASAEGPPDIERERG